MYIFSLLLFFVIIFSIYSLIEFILHQRRIYSIPIRIHINGTRGKSSVTRLIGAGLIEHNLKTITKVTGTYPRLILEDGTETSIFRKANANIIEQLNIVKFAAKRKADALVIECMALEPQYQTITETKMIHATIGVITNVRLDHIDVMGYTVEEIASVLARTIPANKDFFTAEDKIPHVLKRLANEKKANIFFTSPDSVSDEEMKHFKYIEHKENVALALGVCMHCGVPRTTAIEGMYKAIPDEGALTRLRINSFGKQIDFFNAFAANDPQSTLMIWKRLNKENYLNGIKILLLNTRHDRLDRAKQLAEMTAKEIGSESDTLVLIGQSTEVVESMAKSYGYKNRIINIGWTTPEAVFEAILSVTPDISSIVAIGNIGGMGGQVVNYFENRSKIND